MSKCLKGVWYEWGESLQKTSLRSLVEVMQHLCFSLPLNRPYSAVCGRAVGYHFGSPGAFNPYYVDRITISLTKFYGMSYYHVWTNIAGATESGYRHRFSNWQLSMLNLSRICPLIKVIDYSTAVHSIVNQEILLTHLSHHST